MTDFAGRIDIELRRGSGGLDVSIRSSRRVAASRVFVAKGVAETTAELPALFSVCATAQAATCVNACEAALGVEPLPEVLRQRQWLVDAETAKEHLWRVLLDWPGFLGEVPAGQPMARVLAAYRRIRETASAQGALFRLGCAGGGQLNGRCADGLGELSAVTTEDVLGMPPARWLALAQTPDGLLRWVEHTSTAPARLLREVLRRGWAGAGRCAVAALPSLSSEQLDERLSGKSADGFIAEPTWNDSAAESSSLTRNLSDPAIAGLAARFGNGLLTRLVAQLMEVSVLLQKLAAGRTGAPRFDAASVSATAPGVGLAQAQAARGLLVHRVAVAGERVSDYRILAPTEWNFHPKGVVAAGLAALPSTDDEKLRRLAGLFVTAVDPCVDYDVIIR